MNIHLAIAIGCSLGAFVHTLVKVRAINNRLNTVNYKQVFLEYWRTDWPSFLISMVVIGIAVFVSSEYLGVKGDLENPKTITELFQLKVNELARTVSVIVGYCADAIVTAYLGGTEQKLIRKAKEEGVPMEDIIKVKENA